MHPMAIEIHFDAIPSDDHIRAIQSALNHKEATCPFCSRVIYELPCVHCGEPDIME
jgi:hypothetical protein